MGGIEGFHNFLKSCLAKHISRNREWDDVAPLAAASYNWLPNQHSKESPFFVMFGRDALTNLKTFNFLPNLGTWGWRKLILGPQDNVKHLPVTDSQPQVGQTTCHRRSKASPQSKHKYR